MSSQAWQPAKRPFVVTKHLNSLVLQSAAQPKSSFNLQSLLKFEDLVRPTTETFATLTTAHEGHVLLAFALLA